MVKPYTEWLSEDYFIFHVREMAGLPSAAELCQTQGARIAQIVRGETRKLSDGERNEILQSRISYYPNDLAVIGWNAAFLYDTEPAPKLRSNFWNTRIRSCWNSAITMNF